MMRFVLAGGYYRSDAVKRFLGSLRGPTQCFFEHDPTNQYDPGEVKVICGEHHIGFIPKVVLHQYGSVMRLDLPGTVTPLDEPCLKYQPIVECISVGFGEDSRLCTRPVRNDKVYEYCI